ncbi:hypothetical protein FACS1894153_4380 [Bacteroidia bacterium]|nr:hypothetical protein FACS1894153_4380 [Bacteroidia bacterium]
MRNLLDYYYYRIAKFYKSFEPWGESGWRLSGGIVLFGIIWANFLSLLLFILSFIDNNFDFESIIYPSGIIFIILGIIFSFRKKYENLAKRYKKDKNSNLKGWLIFLYGILSFVIYCVSVHVFNHTSKI